MNCMMMSVKPAKHDDVVLLQVLNQFIHEPTWFHRHIGSGEATNLLRKDKNPVFELGWLVMFIPLGDFSENQSLMLFPTFFLWLLNYSIFVTSSFNPYLIIRFCFLYFKSLIFQLFVDTNLERILSERELQLWRSMRIVSYEGSTSIFTAMTTPDRILCLILTTWGFIWSFSLSFDDTSAFISNLDGLCKMTIEVFLVLCYIFWKELLGSCRLLFGSLLSDRFGWRRSWEFLKPWSFSISGLLNESRSSVRFSSRFIWLLTSLWVHRGIRTNFLANPDFYLAMIPSDSNSRMSIVQLTLVLCCKLNFILKLCRLIFFIGHDLLGVDCVISVALNDGGSARLTNFLFQTYRFSIFIL